MKRIIYIIFAIVHVTTCYPQSVNSDYKTTNMRKFDLEAFEKHKTGNDTFCRYKTINNNGDSIEIYLEDNKDAYLEYISYINTPLKEKFTYSKRTLNMISEIETFYNCAIGVKKEYDEKGELIKITDNDKPYKFSWQDLVKKMKEEYDIELMDIKEQIKKKNYVSSVKRSPQTMLYYINMPREMIQSNAARLERFEINANTGEVTNHFGNPMRELSKQKTDSTAVRKWSPLMD